MVSARPLPAVKTYSIRVEGFPEQLYNSRSPGKALAECWRDYSTFDDSLSFKVFLTKSRLRRVPNPPGVGERIMVAGECGIRLVSGGGQYVRYMRESDDMVLLSHPADVKPFVEQTT